MTVLVARPPLEILSMSVMQTGSRRLSARLQEKDDIQTRSNGVQHGGEVSKASTKSQSSRQTAGTKRKNAYDEEDDGFAFSRVKKKKPRQTQEDAASTASTKTMAETPTTQTKPTSKSRLQPIPEPAPQSQPQPTTESGDTARAVTKKRNKMSFSTPNAKEPQPVRRSKRLSSEVASHDGSPASIPPPIAIQTKKRVKRNSKDLQQEKPPETNGIEEPEQRGASKPEPVESSESNHSGTKIALPFADTPVIRRNKAMRHGKSMGGDRRSSLGLRGRRASSLIDSGSSNALPHQEVQAQDFYKHIESDLLEPRRMKQLLTWCATRAMHAKPKGTDFEDASAKSAARVIEEELLKELANRSELSDWFSRDDTLEPAQPLPERPNPKNLQNTQKISELEEQIQRLKAERDALEALLKPPQISEVEESQDLTAIDRSLLSEEDAALLDLLGQSQFSGSSISRRINDVSRSLGPSVDRFADSIHKVAQYRTAADGLASRVLSRCADKFAHREREGRKKALGTDTDRSPGRDLGSVLRGLSKVDR